MVLKLTRKLFSFITIVLLFILYAAFDIIKVFHWLDIYMLFGAHVVYSERVFEDESLW